MADIATLIDFTAATRARAAEVDANFTEIRNTVNADFFQKNKVGQTVTVAATWSAAQTFQAAVTVSAGGIAVTGNSTITGTLGGITGLTVASGGIVVTAGNFSMGAGQAALKYYNAGNSGASLTINWNNGQEQRVVLTASGPTLTLTNPVAGTYYTIGLVQDGTGTRLIPTFSPVPVWDSGTTPTLTTTASRKDKLVLFYNGTNYEGTIGALNLNTTN